MEDDFSIFHTGNFLPFYFHFVLKIFHSILIPFQIFFHIPFHTSIPRKQCNVYFAPLRLYKQPLVNVRETTQRCNDPYLVCTLHMVYCIGVARIFDWGRGPNRKSHAIFMGQKIKDQKLGVCWFGT